MQRAKKKKLKDDLTKVVIPRELLHVILETQVKDNLDFDEACKKVAALSRRNIKRFDQEVERKAQERFKSIFMRGLNDWKRKVRDEVRATETIFRVPCSKCGKPMEFSHRADNWPKSERTLNKAFNTWSHVKCGNSNIGTAQVQ